MVVSIGLFEGRVPRKLEWTDQARGPVEGLDRLPQIG